VVLGYLTYLPAQLIGTWFYLYLVLDLLYSRKIVAWEVHDTDDADHAAHVVRRAALAEGIAALESGPILHGDNGATLRATTVLAMLNLLGLKALYSRPCLSDDNGFVESLFRTAKYRPEFPADGFGDLIAAREWASRFVRWYSHEHRHSGIRYVRPAERHAGEDGAILAARHAVYLQAHSRNPSRWSRDTRKLDAAGPVALNPERDSVVTAAGVRGHKRAQAA
jgi:transposase InsO family protein